MSFQVVQTSGVAVSDGDDRRSLFLEIKARDHLGAETVLRWPISRAPKGNR
jgi:hypothetical protein